MTPPAAFSYRIKVDSVEQTSVELLSMTWGLTEPRTCMLREPNLRGDSASSVISLNSLIEISTDDFTTMIFTGWVKRRVAKNAVKDGIGWFAGDMKWRLLNEIRAYRNGGYVWAYNRNGEPDGTAPGLGWWNFWTCGEAFEDMMEHARGIPGSGSAIPTHHTDSGDVTGSYLDSDDIADWTPADLLDMDRELLTCDVNGHFLGEIFNYLCAEQTDVSWYIDPDTTNLELIDISTSSAVNVNAGELGHHADEVGEDYNLQVLNIVNSLEGVYSKVTIQGADKHSEAKPDDIVFPAGIDAGGAGDAEMEKGWDTSLEGSWSQATWDAGGYDDDDSYEWVWRLYIVKPESQWPWIGGYVHASTPLIWSGWIFYDQPGVGKKRSTSGTAGRFLPYGDKGVCLYVNPVPAPYRNYTMYCWYRWAEPFVVSVGHSGQAYNDYGHEAELLVVDEQFMHSTSTWPDDTGYSEENVRDDTTRMTSIANTLHSLVSKETKSAELQISPIDLSTYTLAKKINVQNLEQWGSIGLQIVDISIDPRANQMMLRCSNKIEGVTKDGMNWYQGEMKRAQREQKFREHRRLLRSLQDHGFNALPGQ